MGRGDDKLSLLKSQLQGELFVDETMRRLYATDASAYREIPLAVAIPETEDDLVKLIHFARENKTSLIPRAGGTSLAGQVVGGGIVVDISKHFRKHIDLNRQTGELWTQPGVVRDDLNFSMKSFGWFFAPETSTANRAMIAGMIGNNSCGSNSVIYGSTREHLLAVEGYLSDGSYVQFGELTDEEFEAKTHGDRLENKIYRHIKSVLSNPLNRQEIERGFPKATIARRNTGYAIDMLLRMSPFTPGGPKFNFSSLIAGSEGTLCFVTAAKLKLSPLEPPFKKVVCIHCSSIDESLRANLVALKYNPSAVELMDHYVFEATKRNILYKENRFFIQGDPMAILVAEITRSSEAEVDRDASALIADLKINNLGYSYPIVGGDDIKKVWNLRKAGLGLLSNIPGDTKPVPVIEDTAVDVNDLPAYIADINIMLKQHGLYSVHYAHAGSGELHLRPYIDLKKEEGVQLFRKVAEETAALVKKYDGSLSGEHGDGRLRGEFIPMMIGEHNYKLICELKKVWDPDNIFNPGKIVDTPPMDTFLRFGKNQVTKEFDTVLDFSETMGILRTAEQCNGSGDCRKTEISGGTMCPSYMATRKEKETTRARANILREMITRSEQPNPFAHDEIKEVMDLCLGCKGCKSECPSNVDLGKLKQEWQFQYYKEKGVPFRSKLIGNFETSMKLASMMPWAYKLFGNLLKPVIGFASGRSLPDVSSKTWKKWYLKEFKVSQRMPAYGQAERQGSEETRRSVFIFIDELLNFNEPVIGISAVKLLDRLGYEVKFVDHVSSGRSFLSKGLLEQARNLARKNVAVFGDVITPETPLIGVEPSAILSFRDEYPDLLRGEEKETAKRIGSSTYMIEEFLAKELDAGRIDTKLFKEQKKVIKLHGHCQQKALSSLTPVKKILTTLGSNEVHMIPSGCCGMAGSFGYEKEHFDLSMQIGELVLFPAVRKQPEDVIIAAAGVSCRHQIKDGTGRRALHPVEVLWSALL